MMKMTTRTTPAGRIVMINGRIVSWTPTPSAHERFAEPREDDRQGER